MKVNDDDIKGCEDLKTDTRSITRSIEILNRKLKEYQAGEFKDKFKGLSEININHKKDPFLTEAKEDFKLLQRSILNRLKEIKESKQEKSDDGDKKIKEQEQKIAELTDMLQRLQAEFENYRKRAEQDKARFMKCASKEVIIKILPVLDSFEIALKNNDVDKEKFVKGVELIYAQLYSILENEGLQPIEALGKKFDPYKHEVLMKQESDKEEDMVIDELQKGYVLNGEVIRHSKVKVSKKK